MDLMIRVSGLIKRYDSFSLDDVSFLLEKGKIIGFIGENGAGKSTTLKCILGIALPDGGEIEVDGEKVSRGDYMYRQKIGVVLDEGYFYEKFKMSEMKSIIAPMYARWREDEYQKYLGIFDLKEDKKIGDLSKGMRMKYAIALALSHEAEILIMDEPTSGIDPVMRSELLDIIEEYMSVKGRSVLFSSHITSDLDKIADDIILIHRGKILFQEEKDLLIERHAVFRGPDKLSPDKKSLFIGYRDGRRGFEGLTDRPEEVETAVSGAERSAPTIEEIMLFYTKRRVSSERDEDTD